MPRGNSSWGAGYRARDIKAQKEIASAFAAGKRGGLMETLAGAAVTGLVVLGGNLAKDALARRKTRQSPDASAPGPATQ